MNYELWDPGVGIAIHATEDPEDMKQIVREMLEHHGSDHADVLVVIVESRISHRITTYNGAPLREWIAEPSAAGGYVSA